MLISASVHAAAASALGYLYQSEIALLEFLRRGDTFDRVALEVADDVTFSRNDVDFSIQVKHHVKPNASIGDRSDELWRTIGAWSDEFDPDESTLYTLITTSVAPSGSIAESLRLDEKTRDSNTARRNLDSVAATARDTLNKFASRYLSLGPEDRDKLVDRIQVIDKSTSLKDLESAFGSVLQHAAPSDRRAALVRRLREWWLVRVERHLLEVASGAEDAISRAEIELKIADIRDGLTSENLPLEHANDAKPTDEEIRADQRKFVMQMRLIALSNERLRLAIHDHNRAWAERGEWARDELITSDDLADFDRRLLEEWERIFTPISDSSSDLEEAELQEAGQAVFTACEQLSVPPLRPKINEAYIARGGFHVLAEELQIGWHPDWVARIQSVVSEVPAG